MKLHRDMCNKREKITQRSVLKARAETVQNGDLHLSVFWNDDKTWTRFNIDKETCVYTITYKCSVGDKMARPLLSVPVFWSTLKGHGDRKSGLPVRIQKSNSG